ncbi:hypothetical protein [Mesorhizobium sp. Cs1299R1N3]|uniref:hypothetical protein n=1 Tax=Mesorhizobium sp. Cs1299R1N3 TaxID=3015173 RepID=UPI00301DFF68
MARRLIEEPVTKADRNGDASNTTHPAFGQIVAHRVSGQATLYGSDFKHNATIRVTIARSELRRDLSKDWHHARNELIEVELSEGQWATFISSLNVGSGTPCTVKHVQGEQMPGLPDPIDRSKQFSGELDGKLKDSIENLQTILSRMDEMGLPKGKTAELRETLETAVREMSANMPFVAESFGRHVAKTVDRAKQEIHGYMQGVINRAGIAALSGEPLPLQIENKTGDDE